MAVDLQVDYVEYADALRATFRARRPPWGAYFDIHSMAIGRTDPESVVMAFRPILDRMSDGFDLAGMNSDECFVAWCSMSHRVIEQGVGLIREVQSRRLRVAQPMVPPPIIPSMTTMIESPRENAQTLERMLELVDEAFRVPPEMLFPDRFRDEILDGFRHSAIFGQAFIRPANPLHDVRVDHWTNAEKVARELLMRMLNDEQRAQMEQNNRFRVVGSNGRVYLIEPHKVMNILDERNGMRYCGGPAGGMPLSDFMLAQKIMLEHDAPAFLRACNSDRLFPRFLDVPRPDWLDARL